MAKKPPPPPTLGPLLAGYLAERGISQAEAARLAVMPQQTVNVILRGDRDPSLSTLLQLLGGLGLSLRWLHEHGIRPPQPAAQD